MSLILNIDTSTEAANVSIAEDGEIIESISNSLQKDHASFLHPSIQRILQSQGKHLSEFDAVAVTAGPGSYTGIRIGMASAKGLCMALNKPFITINTLELLAKDAIIHSPAHPLALYCPMIDARRMEVYTALYDHSWNEVLKPCAMVLDNTSFHQFTPDHTFISFGNGSIKWKNTLKNIHPVFIENVNIPGAMAIISFERYTSKVFTDLVYSTPLYVKDFYNGI